MNRSEKFLDELELPERMAATDALFWYAESALPIFRPLIAGLYLLDQPPDPKQMESGLRAAVQAIPRLHQRVLEAPYNVGLPAYVEDRHFDPAYHLRHISVPPPGTMRALLDLTASLFATPIDRQRPLWEAYWIDGLEGGRAAFFFKTHHSLVDGVGSIALLRALTRSERDHPPPHVRRSKRHRANADGRVGSELAKLAVDQAAAAWQLAGRAARLPFEAALHPLQTLEDVQRTVRGLRGAVADLQQPAIKDPLLGTTSGLSRRLDIMDVSLDRLRAIKEPLGVTINDLVLAVLAGTLRALHDERHKHVGELNCMVPMNLRGSDESHVLGNRVGVINIRLPVGERRPERRLQLIVQQTRSAKSDRRGASYPFLLDLLALVPGAAFRWLGQQALGRVNVACTNVPGVTEPRYMAGARIEAIYPFASVVEGTPVIVAMLSYAGRMDIGIDTDPEAIPDPHRVVVHFEAALKEMETLAQRAAA
jgi:WS/DGAT/MGAT family acyltransferase